MNSKLKNTPKLLNADPYEAGWIFKIKISDKLELKGLLSKEQYNHYLRNPTYCKTDIL
ncbi:hypothetical protein MXB_5641, partial [Myxobolus squamalis]